MADGKATPPIMSGKAAKAAGLTHYFTGKPCKRGHVGLRLSSTLQCCQCLYEACKAWRILNAEKSKELDRRWKEEHRGLINKRYRDSYAKDPDRFIRKSKEYYRRNADRIRAEHREHHHATYDEAKSAAAVERAKQWAIDHPERAKANRRNGKARRKKAIGSHQASDIREINKLQRGRCAYCREKLHGDHHVDHIVAISRGGTNDRRNLQLLCAPCNLKKWAHDPIDHAQSIGLLI